MLDAYAALFMIPRREGRSVPQVGGLDPAFLPSYSGGPDADTPAFDLRPHVARVISYLVSDKARLITGNIVHLR